MAVVFMSRMEGNETVNEGLCLKCAKELGIPQVSSMMDSMGITDDDIEEMSNQLMELGGGDFEWAAQIRCLRFYKIFSAEWRPEQKK